MMLQGVPVAGYPFSYVGDPNGRLHGTTTVSSDVEVPLDTSSPATASTEYPSGHVRIL